MDPENAAGKWRKVLDEILMGKRSVPGTLPGCDMPDAMTRLAVQRTRLALTRSFQAAERTLMAWVRTALSMIGFGFTIGKLDQVLQDATVRGLPGLRQIGLQGIAYFLLILGTLGLFGACLEFRTRVRELRDLGLDAGLSISFLMAVILVATGVVSFIALVLQA